MRGDDKETENVDAGNGGCVLFFDCRGVGASDWRRNIDSYFLGKF